jgi:formylglycine-generating enzyme required for sulfatase activity
VLRKLVISAPLLLATVAVVWTGLPLPPPQWILKYGPAPGCEPQGTETVRGVEFVVIGPGIARIGSAWQAETGYSGRGDGDLLGRVAVPLGMGWTPAPSQEMPVHWTEFPRGFALAKREITNAQFEAFRPGRGRAPRSPGDRDPVVNVSFSEAREYCAWLAEESGRPIRLPSESEWEAACRAGSGKEYCFGDDAERLGEYAWYAGNSDSRAHEVGTRKPNAWGFHDLHGNVWEWCEDPWHASYHLTTTRPGPDGRPPVEVVNRAPTDGSAWLLDGSSRAMVVRGGSRVDPPANCRSACRYGLVRQDLWNCLGFRPACGR